MHNTISRVCIHKGCETQPNHYDESGNKVYCAKHAPSGSYAAYKKCGYVGCETVPTFGLPGGKREFCKAHKSDCHVDLNNPVCAGDNCLKQAKFGPVGGKPIYCVKHSQPNHRNLACKVCEHPDCDTQPTYGYLDEKRTHCMLHALDGMSPVIKRRCEVLDCHARATCGLLYGKKAHCAEHKLDAEYANNHPRCIVDSCRGDAYFAPNVGEYPTYCDQHGDRYVDVVRVTCPTCNNVAALMDGICIDCDSQLHMKSHKVRETRVKKAIELAGIVYKSYDRKVLGGYSAYRPDFVIERDSFVIVVECDEDQHRIRGNSCEMVRMMGVFQDFHGKPVCFVRYNPDSYTDTSGKRIPYAPTREKRLASIISQLSDRKQMPHLINVVYMYYDGYDGKSTITKLDYDEFVRQRYTEGIAP
jgi:hypothetical protein